MDHTTLSNAIRDKDIKVLSWYVQHSEGAVMVHELDAEARMAYYQLLYSQQQAVQTFHSETLNSLGGAHNFTSLSETATGKFLSQIGGVVNNSSLPLPTVNVSVPRWFEAPSSAEDRRGAAAEKVRSAASISLREASKPPQHAAPLHYLLRSSSTASSASTAPSAPSEAPTASLGSTSDLPFLLQRKLSRRLFRSYTSYLVGDGNAKNTEDDDQTYGSPKGETSTFLLSQVDACVRGGSLLSPRSHQLEQKNVTLHEDEEREDIIAMEAYEVHTLIGLMRDSLQRAIRQTQARERVDAATVEAEDRLRISLLQSQMWTAFSNAVWTWLHGPAKEQNALLMNETVLRNRIGLEEEKDRAFLLSFHLKEAENQLTEHRRLRWLLHEHDRANTMHKQLLMALALQGAAIDSPSDVMVSRQDAVDGNAEGNNQMRFQHPSIEAQIMQRFNGLNRRATAQQAPLNASSSSLHAHERFDHVASDRMSQQQSSLLTSRGSTVTKAPPVNNFLRTPHGLESGNKECAVS